MTIDPTPLRASRDIRLLVGGQTINLIGNQISLAAVPYQVFLITHSSLAVGALSLVQFVTVMCCYLLGGSLADIVDRRRLMLVTQSLLAGTATLLAVAALLGRPPPLVHRRRRLRGRDRGYDNPARRATIPRLVPRDQISNAFSLNQVLTRLGSVAGPSVAGIILSKGGTAYAINVGTFLVSLVAVYLISPLPPEGEGAPPPSDRRDRGKLRLSQR